MTRSQWLVIGFLFLIVSLNLAIPLLVPPQLIQIKSEVFSLSSGNRYFGTLNLWYYLAQNQHWQAASKIQSLLNPADIAYYSLKHNPSVLKKSINGLIIKANKTADDWVELARIQYVLGRQQDALDSLTHARNLDPVREDICKAYYELSAQK